VNKKLRILFISHDSELNGGERSLLMLLSGLDRNAFEPYVVVPCPGPLVNELEGLKIPHFIRFMVRWVPYADDWGARNLWKLLRYLRARVWAIAAIVDRHCIDIVYTNTVTNIDGAIAAHITNRRHIWHLREHIRGNQGIKPYIPSRLISLIIQRASRKVIVVSESVHREFSRGSLRGVMEIVHNGVDLELFLSARECKGGLRVELGMDKGTKIVAIVGSLIPQKGHRTFIKMAHLIREQRGDVAFAIVGKGRLRGELEKEVADTGLEHIFHFLGWRVDMADIMQSIDLLVSASESEGMSRVILEAMAAARPVVATRSGGAEDIVIEGETGFLIPVNDAERMATAALRILTDESYAAKLGAAGRNRVERFFSAESYVKSVSEIIKRSAC
jgi:glycosyltransferase involved in cell wall biosynthesis